MAKFFNRTDKRDIEELIFDIAEHNKEEDHHRLYDLLSGRELFLPVVPESLPANYVPGSKVIVNSSMRIRVRNVQGPNGEVFIPGSTQEDCPMIQDGYIGMGWFEYLKMALRTPSVSGVLIQGEKSWVGLDKLRIQYILQHYDV
ncbi:hypothetical protein BGP77_00270 [Saccharospirillum sp. MSK14-1]|uniref:SseB family protein n=1 Tax=Saccharospirillum sp. MSK14-1 TaxID=1897632 RepID=UPI000D3621EE|nr:SseB family protein [Saccharospirillum sp. MSK14-1]PTY35802.1 hypothetical protein BGP77_00270 [Saccharospirillum sp. MSK14-1]